MTLGRTTLNNSRVYADGYDLSGYSRDWSTLGCTFDEGTDDALTLAIKGTMLGQASIQFGPLNGIFDNTASTGIHTVMPAKKGTLVDVMVPMGIQAAPAAGDPVWCAQLEMLGYQASSSNPITVTIPFSQSARATSLLYARPWGTLLHAKGAETAVNTANGYGGLGATTKGGWMMYEIFTAAGTGTMTTTLKVQDCATAGGVYADLLTTGALNLGSGGVFSGPTSGVVALATTANVASYTRWQIVLTSVTSVTFALSFHRGNR